MSSYEDFLEAEVELRRARLAHEFHPSEVTLAKYVSALRGYELTHHEGYSEKLPRSTPLGPITMIAGTESEYGVETSELATAIVKLGWTANGNGDLVEPEQYDSESEQGIESDDEDELDESQFYERDKYFELCDEFTTEIDCYTVRAARILASGRDHTQIEWPDDLSKREIAEARELQQLIEDASFMVWSPKYGGYWTIDQRVYEAIIAAQKKRVT